MSDRSDERQPYTGGSAEPDDGAHDDPYRGRPPADPYLQQYVDPYGQPADPYAAQPPDPYARPGEPGYVDPNAPQPGYGEPAAYPQQGYSGQGGYGSGPEAGYGDPYGSGSNAGGYDPYAQQQPPPQQQQPDQGGGAWFRDELSDPPANDPYVGVDELFTPEAPARYDSGGQYAGDQYSGGQYSGGQHDPSSPYDPSAQSQQYGGGGYGSGDPYQQQHQAPPAQNYQQPQQQHQQQVHQQAYVPQQPSPQQGQGGWGDYDRPGGWLMDQTLTGINLGLAGDIAGMPSYTEAYQRYETQHRAEAAAASMSASAVLDAPPVPLNPSTSPVYRMPGSGAEERMAGIPVGGEGKKGSKLGGIMRSSAVMAAGTIVSRMTGFARNLVAAAALGTAVLANTYNVANTMPTLLYILVGGGALNAVFVPQLVRAMRQDDDGGEAYANRLLTLVMSALLALVVLAWFGAPLLIRAFANSLAKYHQDYELAITFARYCLPIIFFMGLHVLFGQILNARERYGPMMWTPVLNNIVIIATFGLYIWVAGTQKNTGQNSDTITPDEIRLLGLGTLLGMVVQSMAMIPYLKAARFRFRPRFDFRGSGMGKALGLAKWTFLFVLANQAGYLVVTQLATAIDTNARNENIHFGVGFTAYSSALLIWQLPQAVITVSVMTAMLPRMSRAAADGDLASVRGDISSGLRLSAVAMIPCAAIFVALGRDIGGFIFAPTGEQSAHWIGYMLMALGLGLIPYSAQYVLLRGFYVYEDTRTPFLNTVWIAGAQAAFAGLAFVALPTKWAGVGIAGGYSLAYLVGVVLAAQRLKKRLGDLDGRRVTRTYTRLLIAAAFGGVAAFFVARVCTGHFGSGMGGSAIAVGAGIVTMFAVFFVAANRMRVEEMTAMTGMIKGRLGR
ncbi:murein biosynthesis integral membrane protein MurJ [Embleya sp. NPDC005971]|uniref:murein biosynthesis integral membrane protein MurJ n=1 Tax=Embleya sp. NPDC005971 TaxID=3156724 RepID=UPI0033E615E8